MNKINDEFPLLYPAAYSVHLQPPLCVAARPGPRVRPLCSLLPLRVAPLPSLHSVYGIYCSVCHLLQSVLVILSNLGVCLVLGVGVGRPGVTCERAWRCIVVADIRPLHVAMTAVAPSRGPATPRPSPFPVISFIDLHLLT